MRYLILIPILALVGCGGKHQASGPVLFVSTLQTPAKAGMPYGTQGTVSPAPGTHRYSDISPAAQVVPVTATPKPGFAAAWNGSDDDSAPGNTHNVTLPLHNGQTAGVQVIFYPIGNG